MLTIYRAVGDVRGSCGHDHRTLSAAARCAEEDGKACTKLPGGNSYSDRCVRAYEGLDERDLTEAEHAELDRIDQIRHRA